MTAVKKIETVDRKAGGTRSQFRRELIKENPDHDPVPH
jgi:hypothetical protein